MSEWNEAKRHATLYDRHLDFRDAWQVFDGRPALYVPSWRNNENRFASLVEIKGTLYTVVWM